MNDYDNPLIHRLKWAYLFLIVITLMAPVLYVMYVSFNENGFKYTKFTRGYAVLQLRPDRGDFSVMGNSSSSDPRICPEHSGCLARIKNIENSNAEQWRHIDAMEKRFNQILISLLVILIGVIVNLGYLVLEIGKH